MPRERKPAKEVSTAQMMEMIAKYVEEAGGGGFAMVQREQNGEMSWIVSAEFGSEAPDSPMVGGAAYGLDKDLRRALEVAAHDCGLIEKEDTAA